MHKPAPKSGTSCLNPVIPESFSKPCGTIRASHWPAGYTNSDFGQENRHSGNRPTGLHNVDRSDDDGDDDEVIRAFTEENCHPRQAPSVKGMPVGMD